MSKSNFVFIERDLIESPAWLGLGRGVAAQVYLLLRGRVKYSKPADGLRSEVWPMTNNGQLLLPYVEALKRFGISAKSLTRAIDSLVERGFIDVAHQGGGCEGDVSRYAISDRWRDWGTEDFIQAKRRKGRPWSTPETKPTGANDRAPRAQTTVVASRTTGANDRGGAFLGQK